MATELASPLPERILLVDHKPTLSKAWAEAFEDIEGVSAHDGDFFDFPADAMVSPANSFGIMDGGLDLAIRDRLGWEVQHRVQREILARFHGELPVGAAVIVETGQGTWPWLVAAPTMRVPENVAGTLNPYLAFRAALLEVRALNASGAASIRSLLCPGLGTSIGGVDPVRCAVQMRMALRSVAGPPRIPSFAGILETHRTLRGA